MMNRTVVKWGGGKARLAEALRQYLPAGDRLMEPFAGSCAVMMNTDYHAAQRWQRDNRSSVFQFLNLIVRGKKCVISLITGIARQGISQANFIKKISCFHILVQSATKNSAVNVARVIKPNVVIGHAFGVIFMMQPFRDLFIVGGAIVFHFVTTFHAVAWPNGFWSSL
ncbi:DNA adenine methylase [Serratia marcescens]|uniref:DNA adenine methylase n=1 Tax=Serratia TaxID=613 RepID=UPI000CE28F49|nr:hypothetical protein C4B62_04055 [Serratia marcescens]